MKDLLRKIRYWLIKKLGGYTELVQQVIPVNYYSAYQIHPARLRKEIRFVDYLEQVVSPQRQDQMSRKLANEITAELISGGFIRVQCTNDPESCEIIYRADLYAIHPTDAEKCGL